MVPTLPGALAPNPVPVISVSQPHSPPHGTFSPAAPPQQAPQRAQGAAEPAADSATAMLGGSAAQQAADGDSLRQQQRRRAAQVTAEDGAHGATGGAAARILSGGRKPLQHDARPGGVAARPGCAAAAGVAAREQPQPHGPKLPASSGSSGSPASKAAMYPQARRQRAERPAESSEDARTGRAAPYPAGVQQDGGASARSGSGATSSASRGAHLRAEPAWSNGEARSELAAPADTAAAGVLQRLQQAQDAERVAHKEVSAAAFIAPIQEQIYLP